MPKINEARFKQAFDKSFSSKAKQVVKKSRIMEKYRTGMPLAQIASDHKITTSYINLLIKKHPKKEAFMKQRKTMCTQLLNERNQQIGKLAEEGVHSVDIAERFKLTQRQVQEIMRSLKTKSKSRKHLGARGLARQELQQARKKLILTAFIQGSSVDKICTKHSITRRRFFQVLREMTLDKKFNKKIYAVLEKRMRQALGLFGRGVVLQTIAERVDLPSGYLHKSLSKLKGYKPARKKHRQRQGQWAIYDTERMLEHAKFDESQWLQVIFNETEARGESQTHRARVRITQILGESKHEKITKTDLHHHIQKNSQIKNRMFENALEELADIGIIKLKGRTIQILDRWKSF